MVGSGGGGCVGEKRGGGEREGRCGKGAQKVVAPLETLGRWGAGTEQFQKLSSVQRQPLKLFY